MEQSSNSTYRIAGLLALLIVGVVVLLRTYSTPKPTEAAPAMPPSVEDQTPPSDAPTQRPEKIFTGDLSRVSPDWQPPQIGRPMMRKAISGYLGLGPADESLRHVGPYPREQVRAIIDLWRSRMPGWQQLQIGKLTLTRLGHDRIAWRAEEGLTVRTVGGVVYELHGKGQWLQSDAWTAERYSPRVSFTIREHRGGFWPKQSPMTDFQPDSTASSFEAQWRSISPSAVGFDLTRFYGFRSGQTTLMTVEGVTAERARGWLDTWRAEHPQYNGMAVGGVRIWREDADDYSVEVAGEIDVTTWDGSRYRVSPDGHCRQQRSWRDLPYRDVQITWLQRDGETIDTGPTMTDTFREPSPWHLLGIR